MKKRKMMNTLHKIINTGLLLITSLSITKAQYTTLELNQPLEDGKSYEFVAAERITFGDGFSLPAGANMYANTDPSHLDYKEPVLTSTKNYIHVRVPNTPLDDLTGLSSLKAKDMQDKIQYYDGLGRLIQSIDVQGSFSMHDIVQAVEYDQFGRQVKQRLPNTLKGIMEFGNLNKGAYRSAYHHEQLEFYEKEMGFTNDYTYAYTRNTYDNSPLNRLVELASPGKAWHTLEGGETKHKIAYTYTSNTASEARLIVPEVNVSGAITKIKLNGEFYGVNQLYKTITTDENNNQTSEFKNKQGNVIMKQSDLGSGILVKTYYVYDKLNLLRMVIPPLAVDYIESTNPNDLLTSHAIIANLCYYYDYDERHRMIKKKLPGAGAVTMCYDKRDRLVAVQDANLNAQDKWQITKYDAFNRPVLTGLYSSTKDQSQLQIEINGYTNLHEQTGTTVLGYTSQSFPSSMTNQNDYLTAMYHDNYNATSFTYVTPARTSFDPALTGFTVVESYYTKGMPTVTKTKLLDSLTGMTNTWLEEVVYYDDKGRVIQTISENAWGGHDRVSTKYDFIGNPLVTLQEHKRTSTTSALYIGRILSYDHAGRIMKTEQVIEGDPGGKVTLAEYRYNELGELEDKIVGDGLQNVDFDYNIRGWLTKVNNHNSMGNDLFAMELTYNDPSQLSVLDESAKFNGNISGMIWNTAGAGDKKAYAYTYDKLNRLKDADYGEYSSSNLSDLSKYNMSVIEYDKNGNIIVLHRYGSSNMIDALECEYIGNQLDVVYDNGSETEGFIEGGSGSNEYTYDNNGNMTSDKNKNISVSYNHLNLPNLVESDGNTDEIEYIYTASGTKLAKQVYQGGATTTRHYIGNIEYNGTTRDILHYEEGYVDLATNTYHYYLKDHLGNTRVVFKNTSGAAEVVQRNDYYPFGMNMTSWHSGTEHKYKYNGKELQDESLDGVKLDWYDYHARQYDPALGRFTAIDPAADDPKNISTSTYVYCINNPILFIDPDGLNWFYYQAEGEEEKSWHWHEGNKATYTNKNGKERTKRGGYEYLVTFTITGTNAYGASTGYLEVFNQNESVLKESGVFSGGGFWTTGEFWSSLNDGNEGVNTDGYTPAEEGNYRMNLSKRDADGPDEINPYYQNNPMPYYGIQYIPDGTKLKRKDGTYYDVNADYGNGRIRLNPPSSDIRADGQSMKDRGLYLHGKHQWYNWRTHGCVCDKDEYVFNYFWSGGGKNVRGIVPFHIKKKK